MGLEESLKTYVESYQRSKSEYDELSDRVVFYDFESGSNKEFLSLSYLLNSVKDDLHSVEQGLLHFILDNCDHIKFE